MMERKRYLDYAKGIGIISIVLAHCIQYFKPMIPVNHFVCSYHVPIFFVVSGFLAWINREKIIEPVSIIKKRACTLLIPYAIYSLINSALKIGVLLAKNALTSEVIKKEMVALFITGNGTVWFLPTLFAVEILFMICRDRIIKWIIPLSVVLLIAPYALYQYLQFPIGVVLIRIVAAGGFYMVGFIVCNFVDKVSIKSEGLAFLAILFGGVVCYTTFGSNYSFFGGRFEYPLPSLLSGVLLSTAVVVGCKWFEDCKINHLMALKFFEYFGKNSLIVMLIHPTILLLFTYPFSGKFWEMDGIVSVVTSFGLFVIMTILQYPTIYVVDRWFGWTLGRNVKVKNNG